MSILKKKKKTVAGGWCDARRMRTTEEEEGKKRGQGQKGGKASTVSFFLVFNLVVVRGRGLLAGFWFIWRMSQRLLRVETEDEVLKVENTT